MSGSASRGKSMVSVSPLRLTWASGAPWNSTWLKPSAWETRTSMPACTELGAAAPAGATTLATAMAATPARNVWRRFTDLSGLGGRRRDGGPRGWLVGRRLVGGRLGDRRVVGGRLVGGRLLARRGLLDRGLGRPGLGRGLRAVVGELGGRGRRVGLGRGVLRQGLGRSEAVGQRLGQLLGVGRLHLADDGAERAFLHLGGDRQAHAVVHDRQAVGGVLRLHALEHLHQP